MKKRLTVSGHACVETLAMLVAMAWADGRLADTERASVLAAAGVLNLTKELRERLHDVLQKPIPVDQILVETLSTKERAFVFVAAAWMAGVDEELDPKEVDMLDETAALMGFSSARKAELERIARDLEPPKEGGRQWAEELDRLFRAIPPRLEEHVSLDEVEVVFE
jgi:uncharacterized membrane protein YebE (DUF533 family)